MRSILVLAGLLITTNAFADEEVALGPEKPDEPLTAPVQVNSTNDSLEVQLWRLGDSHDVIRCTTPCALDLPPGLYHLHSGGKWTSHREFGETIEVGPNGYRTTLQGGTRAGHAWGVVLTTYAAMTFLGHAVMLTQFLSFPDDPYNQSMFTVLSAFTAVIGGGSLAAGLLLLNENGKGPVGERRSDSATAPPVPRSTGLTVPFGFRF